MIVKKFEQITKNHPKDSKYGGDWSRPYEYATVLEELKSIGSNLKVHNACWGFEGCHVKFKNELEKLYGLENVVNSDMKESLIPNTHRWNILLDPPSEWEEYFDVAMCISTIEEIENFPGAWEVKGGKFHRQVWALHQLTRTVKPGGHVIITFDYPGLELTQFENFLKHEYKYNKDTALLSDGRHTLSCGLIVLRKAS
tara:strand:- start:939 stop:1532 length:594 start_codon:yes stop_codon:yes gene_type:complete